MPLYRYKALDQRGRSRRGRINAESPAEASRSLRSEGLNPLQIAEIETVKAPKSFSLFRAKSLLSRRQLVLILRQLATMLRSGEPLTEALSALERQSVSQQRQLLVSVRQRVTEGETFAHALAQFPGDFKPLYIASITAGEKTGRLDEVLMQLATHIEEQGNLRRNLLLALTYPAILALAAVGIVIGLLVFVMPQLVQVFDAVDMTLPVLTRCLLILSSGLQEFGGFLLLISVITVLLVIFVYRSQRGRQLIDGQLLSMPVLGRLIRDVEVSRFTRTMALVCGNAVPVPEALKLSATAVVNWEICSQLVRVSQEVVRGVSLSNALAHHGNFPPLLVQLVHTGESNGNLGDALDYAAGLMETELSHRLQVVIGVLEPVLILVMGGAVLLIVLAILVPVLDMNTLVY